MSNSKSRGYTIGNFLLDLFLLIITGGLWIAFIIIRELRQMNS